MPYALYLIALVVVIAIEAIVLDGAVFFVVLALTAVAFGLGLRFVPGARRRA
jgi:hypothetical protein